MPIHDQSYQHWNGTFRKHELSWWIIAKQGLRVIVHRKMLMLFILAPAVIQFFIYGGIIYGVNTYGAMLNLSIINPKFFFDFIMRQTFFIALMCVFAGSGLIANDLRNNALQLYFSKPIKRLDYIVGKLLTIFILLGFITLIPGILLFTENAVISQDLTFLIEDFWLIGSITLFSLIIVITTGFMILAFSSTTRNNRYAAIGFIAILIGTPIFSGLLKEVLNLKWASFISYWSNMYAVGSRIFGLPPVVSAFWKGTDYWYWSIVIILAIIATSILVIMKRVRGVEIIK